LLRTATGTEALFADLGHFPVSAVQIAFTVVVFPCLLLAYSGQAAYLMQNKEHVVDAFYRSIPGKKSFLVGFPSLLLLLSFSSFPATSCEVHVMVILLLCNAKIEKDKQ
jgi:K+ transporter